MAGENPDLENEYRGHQTIAIVVSFTALALLTVILRCYTRFFLLKGHGLDDIFIVIAMLYWHEHMSISAYGSGRHVQFVTLEMNTMSLKYLFASIHCYNVGLTTTKLAILILYRRIFVVKGMQITSIVLMVIVVLYGLSTIISGIWYCIPIEAFWDTTIKGAKCVNQFTLYFANAGINIATDCAILILPVPFIKKLQIPKRQKVTLVVILSLGAFTCLTSIFRLTALHTLLKSKDPTWDQPATAYWSAIELNMGIICACLATLRPLVSRIAPRLLNTTTFLRSGPSGNGTEDSNRLYPEERELRNGARHDNRSQRTDVSLEEHPYRSQVYFHPKMGSQGSDKPIYPAY
ncbi:hypothetical protein FQN54_001550 [Arachnomyces sp. PD_36]|nr:hypothetical protein FQN54_001550 [Arachnomyces sp. PD_36]